MQTPSTRAGKPRRIAITAMAVALCLLLSACSSFSFPWESGSNYDHEAGGRRTIPYSEMEYKRPDAEAIKTRLGELTEGIQNAASYEELKALDEESEAMSEDYATMRSQANLKKYHDVNDSYWEEEYRYLEDQSVEISNLINDLNRAIIEGPYADDYRQAVGDYVYQSMVDSLRLNSVEVADYKKERAQLNADYNKEISTLTVSYEGEEYTMADLNEMEDPYQQIGLMLLFYEENADHFTEMYARMVELDKQTAATLGFASAADMYYLSFTRDYTPADTLALCEKIKEIFVPLVPQVMGYYEDSGTTKLDKTFKAVPGMVANVSDELAEAWDHMITYKLYDYEPLPGKQSGVAFTTQLYLWDAPFCYGYYTDDMYSASTVVHEFGHYYENWLYYDTDVVQNLDIAEVYSQGLELLMQPYYDKLTNKPEEARLVSLRNFLQAITYQAMLEEFQLRLYELDSFTSEEVGMLYADILREYNYDDYVMAYEGEPDNSWYSITHLFDAPFYTISYTTSAMAALQIWAESQQDWRTGADTYLRLIHEDQNQPFYQLLEQAGLKRVDDEAVMQEIAGYFSDSFAEVDTAA